MERFWSQIRRWFQSLNSAVVAVLGACLLLAHGPLSAQPPSYLQRVNAGGLAYSANGKTWAADQAYAAGSWGYVGNSGTYKTPDAIANTTDDALYQSERWGMSAYRFTVPGAGRYRVDLHFAEIWFQQPGLRVFNVLIESQPVLQNLDLYATVGHDVAVGYSFEIEVSDGILDVTFGSVVEDPKISALEVASVSTADVTSPVISQVLANNVTSSAATITWLTDEPSDSQVEYGTTESYGNASPLDPLRITNHTIQLTGLAINTTYHYRVRSKDAAGNLATSADFVFQTSSSLTSVMVLNDALNGSTSGARTGGQFVSGGGWQVTGAEDMIVFDLGRYVENGSLEIDVRNFQPGTQNSHDRQHFLGMFRNPWGNHHPVENQETVWDLHAGFYYTPGVKLLSWTYDANEINTVVPDNWNAAQTYHLTLTWSGQQLQYFRDGVLYATHIHSTEMQLRYVFLGRDFTVSGDLITNFRNNQYPALVGPIYSNLTIKENISVIDQTPPLVQNHSISDLYANAARVSWTANETAVCYLEYGLTNAYGQRTPVLGPPAQTFATTLANLTPQQTYHYRVVARDEAGNLATSADHTFTTVPSGTYLFKSAADTYVEQAGLVGTTRDHANFGWMNLMLSAGRESYLRFQVSGLSAQVTQVKLRLHGRQSGTSSATVRRLTASWNENTVTWLTKPTQFGNTLGTLNNVTANQWQEVVLPDFVSGNGTFDLALLGTGTGAASLDSRESSNFQPELLITTLPETPSLALVSPNGGEWWLSGANRTISWNASASISSLKIELATRTGGQWSTITSNAPNTGSFAWLIPDTVSNQALIRITDSGGSGASDVSDAVFVMTRSALINFTPATNNPRFSPGPAGSWDESIRERGWVMYENGLYHMWYGGWRGAYTRSTPSLVDMGYATSSDGINWTKFAGNPIQTNFWTEDFAVLKNGNTYYLYAEDEYTGDGDGARIDLYTSTDKITWTRYGTVLTRGSSGWENDEVGTPVVWKEGDTWHMLYEGLGQAFAGQVGLATSVDGKNWTRDPRNPVLANPFGNQLDIAIDSIIKINGVYHAYAHYDTGGLNWVGGLYLSSDLISWSAYPDNPMTYTSPMIVDTGADYRMYGVVHIPVGHSEYHLAFGTPADDPPPPTLTLVSPNGGENWTIGSTHTIQWNSTGTLANVKLEYSTDNGVSWTAIVATTANDGGHDWVVPNAVSSQCLVRVSDAQDADPADRSDSNFTISAAADVTPPAVTISTPANNGQMLKGNISFAGTANDNTGVAKVEWQLDGTTGAWNVATGTTTWNFTIPQPSEGNHSVYVRATDTASPANTSAPVTRTFIADNTAPVISNAAAGSLTSSSANITWTTNEASDSQVEYGLSTSYGSQSPLNSNLVTTHSVALSNLQANTTYHYRVKSSDAAGNLAISDDFTFTTAPSAPIFSDNFTGNSLNTGKWRRGTNSGNQTRVSNNQLQLRSSGAQTGWIVTKQAFTARNTVVAVKVVQPNNDGDLGMSPTYNLSSSNGIYSQANWYRFYTYRNQSSGRYLLFVQWKKNGIEGGLDVTGSLNITGTVYLRLRMDETEIHFEASLNNVTWIDTYHEPFGLPGYTLNSAFYYELAAYRTSQKGVLIVDDFTITGGQSLAKFAEAAPKFEDTEAPMPASIKLTNYPNPFNISTRLHFELPQAAEVTLAVYDLSGRQVRELANGSFPAGRHEFMWDGGSQEGAYLGTGTYMVRLRYREENSNQEGQIVRRVLLLK